MSDLIIAGFQVLSVFILGVVAGGALNEWIMKPARDAKGRFTCSKKGRYKK